jgi:hypothetical protein
MGKLARIATVVFGAWHSHVWARRCYWSRINKDRLIEVTIGLTESMGEGNTTQCLLMGNGAEGFTN